LTLAMNIAVASMKAGRRVATLAQMIQAVKDLVPAGSPAMAAE